MKSKIRSRPSRPDRWFEILESRFLLSDASPTPKPVVATMPNNPSVVNQLSRSQVAPSSAATVGLSLQDDSYSLDPGEDVPAVRVDLLWPTSATASNAKLLVSSGSGSLLYDLPLDGVDAMATELPIPSNSSTPAVLDIDLLVNRPALGSTNTPGSFQMSIYWNQATPPNDPLPQWKPQSLPNRIPSPADFSIAAFPPTFPASPALPQNPSLSVTQKLPTFAPTSNNRGASPSKSESGSSQGSVQLSGSPNAPSTGLINDSASSRSDPQPHVESGSVSIDGLAQGNAVGQGVRSANVGPLPLSGTTPDGGIFTYPNAPSKESETAIEPTTTLDHLPPIAVPLERPQGLAEVVRREIIGRSMLIPTIPRRSIAPIACPSDLELSSEPDLSGLVFLPPISALTLSQPANQVDRQSRWLTVPDRSEGASRQIRVASSIAAALIGSAGLLLGLFAPDCVSRLAAWSEDRRSMGRRVPLKFD